MLAPVQLLTVKQVAECATSDSACGRRSVGHISLNRRHTRIISSNGESNRCASHNIVRISTCVYRTSLNQYFNLVVAERASPLSAHVLGAFPAARDIIYTDVLKYYTWKNDKTWKRRSEPKRTNTVGLMYSANLRDSERFSYDVCF